MKVPVQDLHSFCVEALTKAGVGEADARTTADVLVTTDTWGTFTHGTKALRAYIRRLRGGGLRINGMPRVVEEGPAWAMVDGDSSLGMVSSVFAMNTAMAKAATAGIGLVGLRNNCHYGAAGYYAAMAIPRSMIGISMANDIPTVNAPGARGPVMGSNPFGFAAPAGQEKPILLDMATSAVAGGKVYAAAQLGKSIPDQWIVDAEGLPSTDPKMFPHAASLVPMAGHKGYGIALLIETLSGILTGASIAGHVLSWSFDDSSRATGHGAAFLAVHVEAMMPGSSFRERLQQTMREIREAPKARGHDRIYLPGEMEWERRERALREGIEMPEDVLAVLRQLAGEAGLDLESIRQR